MNKSPRSIVFIVLISITVISLALWISTIVYDESPFNKNLCKGILGISLAGAFHFQMEHQKKNEPEKYKKNTHWLVVIVWGFIGLMALIDFIRFKFW
jgi:hypothetical protein